MASALHREALVLTGLSLVLIYLGALALFLRAASGQAGEPGPAVPAAAARHSAALGSQSNRATATARATASYASLPLSFEVNRGQADASIQFLSRGKGYVLLLTRSAALLSLKAPKPSADQLAHLAGTATQAAAQEASTESSVVRMELVGADPQTQVSGAAPLPGKVNYFIGSDPAKWRSGVPTYAKVHYAGVYPGIDLVYYGNHGQLEYDFVLAPHADPGRIRLRFGGAKHVAVDANGDLNVAASTGQVSFHTPVVYQQRDGRRQPVAGSFALLAGNSVGFRLGSYDHSQPLVIDPTLVYSTYLGGSGFTGDNAAGIAIDKDGNAYIAGSTNSTDFPVVTGSYDTTDPATSEHVVFITKLNAAGTAEVYSTYLGGTWGDWAEAIALDSDGNAYVTGYTWSPNFPVTTGAYQTTNVGWAHSVVNAFITKLSADGSSLVYSTYLGGTGTLSIYGDTADAIAVDSAGNAYVTGEAYSTNFPVTSGVYQATNKATQSGSNVFVTELSADGTGLVFSTYLGGSGIDLLGDTGHAIAIDGGGNVYVAGGSYSTDFPTTKGAYQTKNYATSNKATNAFAAKLNPTGTALVYSTLLGGAGSADGGDTAYGLAVDSAGDAYVAGEAYSGAYPVTKGAFQTTNYGANYLSSNVFVTKLDPAASGLVYSTFIGGGGSVEGPGDAAHGLALDSYGDAYIAGRTYSPYYPVTVNAYQTARNENDDCEPFVTVVDAAGSGLIYSTYFGGSGSDSAAGLATDGKGNIYFAGTTYSGDFPVTKGAFQTTNHAATKDSAGTNAFIAKLALGAAESPVATTTTLVSNENPAPASASITMTATVKAKTGSTIPAGNVVFTVNGTTVDTVALSAAGQAKLSRSFSEPGSYAIEARYAGNASFAASSASLTEVVKEPATPAPAIKPAGGTYNRIVSVTLNDSIKGAPIYYTLNGATPTARSTRYTTTIKIGKNTVLKAIAVASGHTASAVAEATYTIKLPAAPTPAFSPVGNTYKSAITVRISDKATTGLEIYYTTNGTTPSVYSTKYTSAGIKVSTNKTIQAIAIATGYSKSAVAKATYKIE
jgi:hypothetical protein